MHLWTEYEGNIVAGKYTLGPLQRSEGRNGFFLTGHDDVPATLRLTEALNDEDDLFRRWQAVTAVAQPNLLPILDYGRTALEGVPLAWALIERSDASLSDVLRDRPLTANEAKEVAVAVASALSALHQAGLVHEHVDVSNVVAVGEVIKLRSDCVRECRGDFEHDTPEAREALRQRDIHDFGLMLVRCLPLEQKDGEARLPAPFNRIVPGTLNGSLSLSDVVAAIEGIRPVWAAPRMTVDQDGAGRITARPQFRKRTTSVATLPELSTQLPANAWDHVPMSAHAARATAAALPLPTTKLPLRRSMRTVQGIVRNATRPYWVGGAIAAALLGIVMWNTAGTHFMADPDGVRPQTVPAATAPVPQAQRPKAQLPKPSASQSFIASMEPGWHVIAYTYNYEEQARAKAQDLQKRYFALQPHVFTPTGHAPYFVALGSGLAQDQANALRHQALRAGLPGDIYIRAF